MTASSELYPGAPKEQILEDICARVRGYTRHLAVASAGPIEKHGSYKLPDSAGFHATPWLHANICNWAAEDPQVNIQQFSLTLSSDFRFDGRENRLDVTVAQESEGVDSFMLFDRPDADPDTSDTITDALARRTLWLLRELDPLIPQLTPEVRTAAALWRMNHR